MHELSLFDPGSSAEPDDSRFPTYVAPATPPSVGDPAEALATLDVGCQLGDYELLRELGTGSFGRVFLARQQSLDRLVALKVTTEPNAEARTLAALEHDHIVRVFGEAHTADGQLHLLAMQYVPGAPLGCVLEALGRRGKADWTGADLLAALDNCLPGPVTDTDARRERERWTRLDHVEAVCRLGAQLASALDHAHRQGILHRDIKPSNVLLHEGARALLADFNLAASPLRGGAGVFGGTLAYMAPEHLDALGSGDAVLQEAVDARADIYSLGVVLHELLAGRRPFASCGKEVTLEEAARFLAAERRGPPPRLRDARPELPPVLERVVRRCLDPEPDQRYASAGELARVLEGCRELHGLHRSAPAGPLTRFARRRPVLTASVLPLLPHLVGALVVVAYTTLWVAQHPAGPQLLGLIGQVAGWYSAVVFPVTGVIAYLLTRPIWYTCGLLQGGDPADSAEVARVRRRALRKPFWGAFLSGLGWLPGALLLPLLVGWLAPGAASWEVALQYGCSFLVAGMIALVHTEFVDQFLLLCVAYPALWVDPVRPRETARAELGQVERRLRLFQVLSGLVPLATGIGLMIWLTTANPEQRATAGYQAFLILVTGLMGLGLAGSWLAVVMSGRLARVAAALAGSEPVPTASPG